MNSFFFFFFEIYTLPIYLSYGRFTADLMKTKFLIYSREVSLKMLYSNKTSSYGEFHEKYHFSDHHNIFQFDISLTLMANYDNVRK